MLPTKSDSTKTAGSMDLDLYITQAETDEAEDKELLEMVAAAKREKENDYRRKWSPERRYAAEVLESVKVEFAMGMVLVFNFLVVVKEVNDTATCVLETKDDSLCNSHTKFMVINTVLLGLYCVELGLKLAVWQRDVFRNRWNVFDGSIVTASLVETIITLTGVALPSMQFLRIFRLVRLARMVRLLHLFPELYFMVHGFASAVAAMWWGFFLIAVWICAWSILSVELVNPTNQRLEHTSEYCEEAFSSVYRAFLLFFQTLVAGDSWGLCILPILQDAPYFGFIFGGAMVSIQLGFTNLVLSCIVDAATKERTKEAKMQARVKKTKEIEAKEALTKMFVAMDRDQTGTITLEEFIQGYESNEDMRTQMAVLHIGKGDLDTVFALIDADNSGSLELGEFCSFIAGMQDPDNRMSMMMLKMQVSRVLQKVVAIQDAMGNVAVVAGAAPAPTQKPEESITTSASRTRGRAMPKLSRSSNSLSEASATSTAQRDEAAAKWGGEHGYVTAQVTAGAPLAVDSKWRRRRVESADVVESADDVMAASSLCFTTEQQASTASTTQRGEAAAKRLGENGEATASAPLTVHANIVRAAGASSWELMPEQDIALWSPPTLRSSRGSNDFAKRLGTSDGVPNPTWGYTSNNHVGGTPRAAPGSSSREARELAPACSTKSCE